MTEIPPYQTASKVLREQTGVVIPVHLPASADTAAAAALVRDTIDSYADLVDAPSRVCVSVDGSPGGDELAKQAVADRGVQRIEREENRGKLAAVAAGVRQLLQDERLTHFAIIDQDGDHLANELITFVRTAVHVHERTGTDQILVLGRRISRHHPMGWGRGELEELVDRVLLDSLQYAAAISDKPLHLEYATVHDEYPDFHSGYKVLTRATAESIFSGSENRAGVSQDCYYRHAVEAVMTVEAIQGGAWLAQVSRTAINEQPMTTFGTLDRCRLNADMIIWPCRRLGVPAPHVDQWLRNHIPRLLLYTHVPDGRDQLNEIRRLVMEDYGCAVTDDLCVPPYV
jgi:hypothetical protein